MIESACEEQGISCKDFDVSFHTYNQNTADKFPTLAIDDSMVPTGRAGAKCIHINWAPTAMAGDLEAYQEV